MAEDLVGVDGLEAVAVAERRILVWRTLKVLMVWVAWTSSLVRVTSMRPKVWGAFGATGQYRSHLRCKIKKSMFKLKLHKSVPLCTK